MILHITVVPEPKPTPENLPDGPRPTNVVYTSILKARTLLAAHAVIREPHGDGFIITLAQSLLTRHQHPLPRPFAHASRARAVTAAPRGSPQAGAGGWGLRACRYSAPVIAHRPPNVAAEHSTVLYCMYCTVTGRMPWRRSLGFALRLRDFRRVAPVGQSSGLGRTLTMPSALGGVWHPLSGPRRHNLPPDQARTMRRYLMGIRGWAPWISR